VLVHNQGGRRGNQATRDQNQKIIEEFLAENPDYTLVGGGRDPATGLNVKEEYQPPLDGSPKHPIRASLLKRLMVPALESTRLIRLCPER
jgi:hypothetical protein